MLEKRMCLLAIALSFFVGACQSNDVDLFADGPLFGIPVENTGLTSEQCQPSCGCSCNEFAPPEYTQTFIDALSTWTLLNAADALTEDPYDNPDAYLTEEDRFCGVLVESAQDKTYRLIDYDSLDEAAAAGAMITHYGACGLCSSLKNLGVYLSYPDMTSSVRECSILGLSEGDEATLQCLMEMGFEENCAQIWQYNANNTASHCRMVCLASVNESYHLPSGELNACLACDEEHSGPVFKAVAGRTRRNSGLPSGICRPCDTVSPVIHEYE